MLLFLFSCLEPSGVVKSPEASETNNVNNNTLSFRPLSLQNVSMPASKNSQVWLDENNYYIFNNMGDLVLYSEQNKVFSEGIGVQNASDYQYLFSFGSLGWQSIKDGSIEYYQGPEKIFVEQSIDTKDQIQSDLVSVLTAGDAKFIQDRKK